MADVSRLPSLIRSLDDNVRALFRGATHAAGSVTLATGTTTTVVKHPGFSANSVVSLEPTNVAMWTEWATTRPRVYDADKDQGQFTITHANAATTRTLSYQFVTPRR